MLLNKNIQRKPIASAMMWLLLCAVLFSQYLGFAHRMSHFSTYGAEVFTIGFDASGSVELRKLTDAEAQIHSCLLVDASTILDALQHYVSLKVRAAQPQLESTSESVAAVFISSPVLFHSRAPPI